MKIHNTNQKIIRKPEAAVFLGTSIATFNRQVKEGVITEPLVLSERTVGYPEYEINALAKARIMGFSTEQKREVVHRLHSLRQQISVDHDTEAKNILREIAGIAETQV